MGEWGGFVRVRGVVWRREGVCARGFEVVGGVFEVGGRGRGVFVPD